MSAELEREAGHERTKRSAKKSPQEAEVSGRVCKNVFFTTSGANSSLGGPHDQSRCSQKGLPPPRALPQRVLGGEFPADVLREAPMGLPGSTGRGGACGGGALTSPKSSAGAGKAGAGKAGASLAAATKQAVGLTFTGCTA